MSANPKTIGTDVLAIKALKQMQDNDISQLLAVDDGQYQGVVHIHNLMKEGII
jgi:arabinose-5-phosphate isomerase